MVFICPFCCCSFESLSRPLFILNSGAMFRNHRLCAVAVQFEIYKVCLRGMPSSAEGSPRLTSTSPLPPLETSLGGQGSPRLFGWEQEMCGASTVVVPAVHYAANVKRYASFHTVQHAWFYTIFLGPPYLSIA